MLNETCKDSAHAIKCIHDTWGSLKINIPYNVKHTIKMIWTGTELCNCNLNYLALPIAYTVFQIAPTDVTITYFISLAVARNTVLAHSRYLNHEVVFMHVSTTKNLTE